MRTRINTCVLFLVAAVFALFAGCQVLRIESAQKAGENDWLTYGSSPTREWMADTPLSLPLEVEWKYNAQAGFGPGSPLILNEAVLVATRKGTIHAVDVESGKKIGVKSFGASIEGPILIHEGIAFIPNAFGSRSLTAYDLSTAHERWKVEGIAFETAPVVAGENIVAIDIEANVRAYDLASGEELWRFSLGDHRSVQSSPLAFTDGRVFTVDDRGHSVMLNGKTGDVVWTRSLGYPVYATPAASGDRLFIPTTRGIMMAVDALAGKEIWTFDVNNRDVRFASPGTDGRLVYVGASNGIFYCLDAATGRVRWQFDGPDAFTAPPLISDRFVFVGSMGRKLYGFDREQEKLVWEVVLDGRVKSGMAARDGALYVLSEPRYVYKFSTPTE